MELTYIGSAHERTIDLKHVPGYGEGLEGDDTVLVWNARNYFTQDVPDDAVEPLLLVTSQNDWARSDELRALHAASADETEEPAVDETAGYSDKSDATSEGDENDAEASPSSTSGRAGRKGRGSTLTQ